MQCTYRTEKQELHKYNKQPLAPIEPNLKYTAS